MSLEGFSKRGMELGNNPEKISETKNNLREQYLNAVKNLASQKMKNDIIYEGLLVATIRRLTSLGLDVSRESISKDIETEINRQKANIDFDVSDFLDNHSDLKNDESIENTYDKTPVETKEETQALIDNLKQNLNSVFDSKIIEPKNDEVKQKEIDTSMPIPENNNLSQVEEVKEEHTDLKFLTTDDVKQRIIQEMESRGEVIISDIDNIYQEGNYIVVDAKDNHGRFTGAEFTVADFNKLVNRPSTYTKIDGIIDKHSGSLGELPFQERPKVEKDEPIEQPIQEEQNQMKNKIISQIMINMDKAGELSFGDMGINERMNIIMDIQNKLDAKSIDELQMLLSTYQKQNEENENMSNEMYR